MFQQAIEIVKIFQDDNALPGLLETLQYMSANRDSLSEKESWAFNIVLNDMSKLFA